MAIFCLKKLKKPLLAGEIMMQKRKSMNLNLEQVSKLINIGENYLRAIENNDLELLPKAKAHCLAYVKKLARMLKLDEKKICNKFCKETGLDNYELIHPGKGIKIRPLASIFMWIKRTSIATVVILFIGYMAWQINGILKPPKLIVTQPTEGYICDELNTVVKGKTEKEVALSINGQEIRPNENGEFESRIDLSNGLNAITITAIKKHGKTTSLTRYVIVRNNDVKKVGLKQ
ncbi:MAG: helix-turn-helix domain-containing protein [bacterium]